VSQPLLSLRISVDYSGKPDALSGVSFEVGGDEIFGLVGESGSGKSTVALAILRLLETRGGRIRGTILFQGSDLMACRERELRHLRGREIGLVLQSPVSALNPALRVEAHLREAWSAHGEAPWREVRPQVRSLLERMDLPADDSFLRRYPQQLSVGQAQRVVIAMAVLHRPKLLIADEPTSALDPVSQTGILELFRRLNRDFGMAILYISHDLASVAALCGRVGVLYAGGLVECGEVRDVFLSPAHPYTRRLVAQFSAAGTMSPSDARDRLRSSVAGAADDSGHSQDLGTHPQAGALRGVEVDL
jgi:ABC-type glutathione transport system ATPase component